MTISNKDSWMIKQIEQCAWCEISLENKPFVEKTDYNGKKYKFCQKCEGQFKEWFCWRD